ncbi:hypothetical protein PGT21_028382 [Puccinia graminis f. sp. tritici]|uniref:BRCT domain-containing protein n=1 Tax=Puccinia graminis f. sp. tritici TaxID=56615 RepID=A0A5B0RR52_PUCGR|nr:hypothetical protein PGT21_028382 [Puccinia graminis f. sp. tritici]KAA1128361.1 hypothetical protein PGTUg99_014046 [Puccinia graminis f. sp. tritici]
MDPRPSQSSLKPSLKRSRCEPSTTSTSRKRVATANSSSDLLDSQSEELNEWQKASIAWKKSYDQKVAQCLARNQLPVGPVEQYLNLTSRIPVTEQSLDSTQNIASPVISLLPQSTRRGVDNLTETHTDSADPNESSAPTFLPQSLTTKTHSGRVLLAPETPDVSMVLQKSSAILAPETPGVPLLRPKSRIVLAPGTPASPSSSHQIKKAPSHIISPELGIRPQISDQQQVNQSTSGNTHHVSSRSDTSNSRGVHRTTSETSFPSGIEVKDTKLPRRRSKLKEIDTLEAYDKLTAKERSARFPSVEIWAAFLTESSRISAKRRKTKDFMSRCRIYYLIDPRVQRNLDDADRMRMRRLFEAGAQIQPELRAKQVTHLIVPNDTSWNSCLRAIKNLVADPAERQTIKDMCLSSLQKTPGDELIWVMDFKWVSSCLSYGAIPVEKYTCIRPRASKMVGSSKHTSMAPPESQDHNRSAEADHPNDTSSDEIETSVSLHPNMYPMVRNPRLDTASRDSGR